MMKLKAVSSKLSDQYFDLVREFPLTRIRDGKHLDAAAQMIDRLLEEHLDKGGEEYLDVLTDLVERYEDEHEPIPDASEADVLRELMRAGDLSQQRLAASVGISQSTISAVLNGTRSLTKHQIISLARFFNVSPGAFLPALPTTRRR
jgi:HTH-type transcriptional regulator / antitoxin HigA